MNSTEKNEILLNKLNFSLIDFTLCILQFSGIWLRYVDKLILTNTDDLIIYFQK